MNSGAINRRVFSGLAAWAGVTAAVPVLWAQARPEKSTFTLALSGRANFAQLPLTVAEQRGYLRAEGLDIQFRDLPSDAAVLRAVADGSADFAAGGFDQVLAASAHGPLLQAFTLLRRTPAAALGIDPRAWPHYSSAADFRGRTVGVPRLGSSAHAVVHRVTTRAGLKTGDVHYVSLPSRAEAVAAIRLGQVDALCHLDPVMTLLEHGGEVRVVADTRTVNGSLRALGALMPEQCVYAAAEFLDRNAQAAHALGRALVRALKWLQTAGPGDLMKLVPEWYWAGDRALYLAAFGNQRDSYSPDGLMPADGPLAALRLMGEVDASLFTQGYELNKTSTNQFVSAQRARLGL